MPQLESSVMEALFWAVVPQLNSVHPMEEKVQELRQVRGGGRGGGVRVSGWWRCGLRDEAEGARRQQSRRDSRRQRFSQSNPLRPNPPDPQPTHHLHLSPPVIVLIASQLLTRDLHRALEPVVAYLATWKKYEALLALVPETYVAALEAKGEDLTLAEIKMEVREALFPFPCPCLASVSRPLRSRLLLLACSFPGCHPSLV